MLSPRKSGRRSGCSLTVKEPAPTKSAASDPKALNVMGHMIQVQDMAAAILKDREPMVPGPSAQGRRVDPRHLQVVAHGENRHAAAEVRRITGHFPGSVSLWAGIRSCTSGWTHWNAS